MRTLGTIFLIAAALVLSACGAPAPSTGSGAGGTYAAVTDDNGRTVSFDQKPARIAVTSASFIAPLYAVGGEVVGRPDSKMKIPDAAKAAPSIGKTYQIDTEKLISLSPDLVLLNRGMNEKLIDTLDANLSLIHI